MTKTKNNEIHVKVENLSVAAQAVLAELRKSPPKSLLRKEKIAGFTKSFAASLKK